MFSLLLCLTLPAIGLLSPAQVDAAPRKAAPQKRRATPARRAPRSVRQSAQAKPRRESERLFEPTAGEAGEYEAEEGDERELIEARERWFMFRRAYPFDAPPAEGRRKAWLARPKDAGDRGGKEGGISVNAIVPTWRSIGPAPTMPKFPNNWGATSGRVNSIAVNPANSQIVLVGAASGGIWRSTDGGANFAPVSDTQVDLSVGSLAFSRSNPAIVYAGMGDTLGGYFGTGILKSTDGGATWARVSNNTLPPLGTTAKIEVDPRDPNRVYVLQANYTSGTSYNDPNPDGNLYRNGFYLSTDGGVNWTRTLRGRPRDLAVHPTDPNILYIGMNLLDISAGVTAPAGVYKSLDGGRTWLPAPILISTYGTNTRDMRVATSANNPNAVYVLSGGSTALSLDVSQDGGLTWTTKSMNGVDPAQFGYNAYIYVDPANAANIYLGTRDLYRTTNGGETWINQTKNYVFNATSSIFVYDPFSSTSHPDQHAFAFALDPANPNLVYLGNDGGISKCDIRGDGTAVCASLNATLRLAQFVGLTAHPTDPNISYGGTQDNGTQVREANGGWREFAEGDGGHPVIIATPGATNSAATMFSAYVGSTIRRWPLRSDGTLPVNSNLTTGAQSFGECPPPNNQNCSPRIAFYPPFTSNGNDQTLYFGTWRLFTSTNLAQTWTTPGGTIDLTKGSPDVLNAIGVERRAGAPVIYTGSAQGRVMVTQNGGVSWTDATIGLPNRFVESLTVDRTNPAVAYVTFSGFGTGHLFRTVNFGQTWTDIGGTPGLAGSIPNVPVNCFLIDPATPSTLYAGSDIGVFRSIDNGATWSTFNNGLLPVIITDFAVTANGTIQAATYGRGIYELASVTVGGANTVQLAAATIAASEAARSVAVRIIRQGDTAGAATVRLATLDNPAAIPCDPTARDPQGNLYSQGTAYARCDYATTVEIVSFAPGETTKDVPIPLIDDAHVEGAETFYVALSSPTGSGASLGAQTTAAIQINDNDVTAGGANPILNTSFFVRQQYLDFLSREPEAGEPWSNVLNTCSNVNNNPNCDRLTVSAAFFGSPEFQLKGFYVYRFYALSFGRLPLYSEIIPDMRGVTGATAAEVYSKRAQFAADWTERPAFKLLYGNASTTTFINALMDHYTGLQTLHTPDPAQPDAGVKVTLTRVDLINRLNAGALSRAQVVRAIAESDEVATAEYNGAFVAMQYFGYLRRDPDTAGFNAWLNYLNSHPGDSRTMVQGFANSREYTARFGQAL